MLQLGDYPLGTTVRFKWPTVDATGASITRATNGSVRIYKNNGTTERASGAGITDTEDFDAVTGIHDLSIDTSDNTDAGFYVSGAEYQVVLVGAVIGSITPVNAVLAHFSLDRPGAVYRARVWMIKDTGGAADRYVISFEKNGAPIFTGISAVTLQVIKASDGSDLIAASSATQIASTGLYKFDATTTARITTGAAYVAKITATIDGATRTMTQPVGRDS